MALDPDRRQHSIGELRSELLDKVETRPPVQKTRQEKIRNSRDIRQPDGAPARAKGWLAFALPLAVLAGGIAAFIASHSGPRSMQAPAAQTARGPDSGEISLMTDPQALLRMAEANPVRLEPIERRLVELGMIKIVQATTVIWRMPGAGVGFRDCPTCPELAVLPAGSFLMGSPASELGRGDDEDDTPGPGGDRVAVSLPRPFAIGRYAVTVAEYSDFVRQSGHKMDPGCHARYGAWQLFPDLSWRSPGFDQDVRHPVVCVSWNDAQAYVSWLSAGTGQRYRLPTEQEREFATRASITNGSHLRYFFGEDENELCAFANIADLDAKAVNTEWSVVNCHDGFAQTAPVGSFKPNAFGLYDMLGNVWEWTADCFRNSLLRHGEAAPVCSDVDQRVLRGGSWRDNGRVVRSAVRISSAPGIRDEIVGFRVARELSQ